MAKDKRVDDYIEKSAPFAKAILKHLRKVVHANCKDVNETIKWSFPVFEYKGSILCNMASFKEHCAFGFWLASQMEDKYDLMLNGKEKTAMGNLGRLTKKSDIPDDKILADYIKQAMNLIDGGAKIKKAPAKKLESKSVPSYFMIALKKNKKALDFFNAFSNSAKKEYIEWLTEAKTDATRDKRLETAIEWISENKRRHWKYER